MAPKSNASTCWRDFGKLGMLLAATLLLWLLWGSIAGSQARLNFNDAEWVLAARARPSGRHF
jgi:cytochrome b